MAVKIRLMRVGKTKQPTYRVVVADSRSPRDGRIIETIGNYGPRQAPSTVTIDEARALDWLRKGAQPTEQVQKLLTITGIWSTFAAERPKPDTKLNRRGFVTGKVAVPVKAEKPAPVASAPAEAAVEDTVEDTAEAAVEPAADAPETTDADEAGE